MVAQQDQWHLETLPGTQPQNPGTRCQSCPQLSAAGLSPWPPSTLGAVTELMPDAMEWAQSPSRWEGAHDGSGWIDSIQPILRPHSHNRPVAPMSAREGSWKTWPTEGGRLTLSVELTVKVVTDICPKATHNDSIPVGRMCQIRASGARLGCMQGRYVENLGFLLSSMMS